MNLHKRNGVHSVIRWGIIILFALLLLTGGVLLFGLLSTPDQDLASHPNPAPSFEEALTRFGQIEQREADGVIDLARSQLYTAGEPTERVFVLVHGTTNSPHQFSEMGELLHANGHNVLILRLPRHGLLSHDVNELRTLTAEELRAYADEAIDLASGLGDEVTVIGLSGGGAITAWIAQNRPDVAQAVLLAPFMGITGLPRWLDTSLMNIAARLPNINLKSASETDRPWVYRGESTRGVSAFLRLGHSVLAGAASTPPAVDDIIVLTTGADDNVNNSVTTRLVDDWQERGATVTAYEFPVDLDIPHDMVDVSTEPAKRSIVLDKLFELIGEALPDEDVSP